MRRPPIAHRSLLVLLAVLGACACKGDHEGEISSEEREEADRVLLGALSSVGVHRGWELSYGFEGVTRLATFPPVTTETGRLVGSAFDPGTGASVALIRLPCRLRADGDTRDSLAVAAPGRLGEGWGAHFRTIWADLGRLRGRRVIEVQGTFREDRGDRVALITWVPHGAGHYVVIAITDPADAGTLEKITAAAAELLPPRGVSDGGEGVLRAALIASVGLAATLALAMAMRRRLFAKK